jgi:tRNA nucleotidyltransferase (CCA-adding enzyme)
MAIGKDIGDGIERLRLGRVGDALAGLDAWIVGGAARALVTGAAPDADVDVAVDADLDPVLERLGLPAKRHDRFGTAVIDLGDGRHADVARTRTEKYEAPGALPVVAPAPIEDDLARRDFTVNAFAIALRPPNPILDPFDGISDLAAGRLRVLHPGSFADDPTRAIRAARYCARLGLRPDEETASLLAGTDLGLVSVDRRNAELARLAGEPDPAAGFRLLSRWGVLSVTDRSLDLIAAIDPVLRTPAWRDQSSARAAAIVLAAEDEGEGRAAALRLAAERPARPSDGVALASGRPVSVLLLAAAAGADWVSSYMGEWRRIELEIDGHDLLAAGVEPGPPVGAGLRGALDLKLNGELAGGRERELEAALRIARATI